MAGWIDGGMARRIKKQAGIITGAGWSKLRSLVQLIMDV